ncbi:MAG: GMC oxidoreductase, partial [Elusimicrobia bacterium]|nr:GMC oxidoreductase [Elusimicrobiota bacterium]
ALSEKDLAPHFEALEADLGLLQDSTSGHAAGRRLEAGASHLGLESRQAQRMALPGPGALRRRAMSATFIPRALQAGCRLLERTAVERLERRAGRWFLKAPRQGLEIEAGTVFLACGAIRTAALLRRCGLAPRAGASLALHPTAKLVARFPDQVNFRDLGVAAQQVKLGHGRFSLGCSVSTPANLALNLLDQPRALSRLAQDWPRMAAYYVMVPGGGAGDVRPLPGCADPLVRYRVCAGELRGLEEGARLLGELLRAAGAEEVFSGPLTAEAARLVTLHLMGTCPMGEDRGLCAADSFGKVHGRAGLHLADASLFCGPLGVNPQALVMALARRNALFLLQSRRP